METKIGPPQSVRLSAGLASTGAVLQALAFCKPLDLPSWNCATDFLGGEVTVTAPKPKIADEAS